MPSASVETKIPDLVQASIPRSVKLVTWESCREKMLSLMSLPVVQATCQEYFAELGEFRLVRNALARNGRPHHPFVKGTDELIFNEVKKRIAQAGEISALELGCGGSFNFFSSVHGGVSEEDQAPCLSRALKQEFGSSIDLTVTDFSDFDLYFHVNQKGVLDPSTRSPSLPTSSVVTRRSYLSASFERLYDLKTISGYEANYETAPEYQSLGGVDFVFARNQRPAHPEYYAEKLIKNIVPKLKDDGVIIFAFDTGTIPGYNSREANHSLVIRKIGSTLDPNIAIIDMFGQQIETITPATFAETKAKRPQFQHVL